MSLASRLSALLAPRPDADPEDATSHDDGTRATGSYGDDEYDEEPDTVPQRRLYDDDDDDGGHVKSSRSELFGKEKDDEVYGETYGDEEDDDEEASDEGSMNSFMKMAMGGAPKQPARHAEEVEDDEEMSEDDLVEDEPPKQRSVFEAVRGGQDLDSLLEGFDAEDVNEASSRAAEAPARAQAGAAARQYHDLYSETMEVRVQLQSMLALVNRLPANGAANASVVGKLEALVRSLAAVGAATAGTGEVEDLDGDLWESMEATNELRRERWEATAEAWRRRTHLGAATKHLKAVNVGPFAQARDALSDLVRCQRKMHPKKDDGTLDVTIYDDAPLYSAQLRDFMDGSNDRSKKRGNDGATDALERSKSKKSTAHGSKASKGRGLKLEAHEKLANFMFPVPSPTPAVDVDMLFRSLFQAAPMAA
ncbi:hypothetical protein M885DRAFT_611701 [Pelagophyceae sp. CCMP2097]|nr:hypothetical protein M885DRAFT_611701 [Pelagophyceae sp. CCMP2097]